LGYSCARAGLCGFSREDKVNINKQTKQMNSIQKLSGVAALLCLGAASAQAAGHTYNLANIASGNWNTSNVRTANSYIIGFNAQHPVESGAYFEYDLTPAQGKTITYANLLIAGSTDFHISDVWPNHPAGQTANQFKVGVAPMTVSANSVSQIVTGNNIANLYHNQVGSSNNDNGYGWVTDGLHVGFRFDAWHYEGTGQRAPRLQNAVNAGGLFVMLVGDRFDNGNDGQNYIWGSTAFNAGNQLQIITSN
jgi:hypothetical protein